MTLFSTSFCDTSYGGKIQSRTDIDNIMSLGYFQKKIVLEIISKIQRKEHENSDSFNIHFFTFVTFYV